MSNPNPARVSAGTPDGGRFAPSARAESGVQLGAALGDQPLTPHELETCLQRILVTFGGDQSAWEAVDNLRSLARIARTYSS